VRIEQASKRELTSNGSGRAVRGQPWTEEVSGNVATSCRYFGISRQAYYTWYRRYQAEGAEGLRTRSKAPKTCPNATHVEVVASTSQGPLGGQTPYERLKQKTTAQA
jgi:transposase-like protein